MYQFILPMRDLTVSDNWVGASAMRGTGSNAVFGQGVLVPPERVVLVGQPPRIDRPLFRVSSFVVLWLPCAAMVIGALRAAMEECVGLVADKISAGPDRQPYIDRWRLQQTLADTCATVDSLSSGLRGVAEDLWAAAVAGEQPSTRLRARWWSMLFYIFDTGRRTVSDLYRSSGSAVYGTRNVVERSMRDIHAIATTFEQPVAQAFRADAGRVLAGKDPNTRSSDTRERTPAAQALVVPSVPCARFGHHRQAAGPRASMRNQSMPAMTPEPSLGLVSGWNSAGSVPSWAAWIGPTCHLTSTFPIRLVCLDSR